MMKHDLAFETLSILTIGRKTFSPTVIYTRYHHGLELFKIYSLNEDGSGFIICASVKHLPPVIGYSLSHLFFPKAIVKNDDTERFLDEIARTAIDNQSRQVTYDADYAKRGGFKLHGPYPSESTAISPMLKTRWNQSSPYNDKTPGYTGCVATAAAQLMKYHEWPVTGTGIIPAYTVGDTTMPAIDINNFMYQWDKMKDIGKGTPEEDNAVADLMLHIGCAVKMHYMSGSSAAFVQDVGPMLSRHYSYDPDVTYGALTPKKSETTFSDYEIISIFRHEIENKRPVQIGGNSHSVVCDGMDENQFFHLNFGWGISGYDGYYNLPHNIWCEDIVADIKPREYLPLSMTPVSSQQILTLGESFFTTVMVKNTTGVDFEGQIVLALADVSGVIIQLLDDNQTVHIPAGTEVPMTFASHLPNIMTCNPRRLYLLANNPSLKYGWKKIPSIFNGNNFFSVNIIRPKTSNKVRLDKSLDTPVAFYRDEMSPVSVILRNIGEPFTGSVALCFVDKNNNVTYEVSRERNVILPAGEVKKLIFSARVPSEVQTGNVYTMKVFYSSEDADPVNMFTPLTGEGTDIIDTVMVTIKSTVHYMDELRLVYTPDYPVNISMRTTTPIAFDLYCENGLDKVVLIHLVIIDGDGIIHYIGSVMEREGYKKGETKHYTITPMMGRNFTPGQYQIGIVAMPAGSPSGAMLVSGAEGVRNPSPIIVIPVLQAPFLRITQSLPAELRLSPGEAFTLDTQMYLLPRENDNYGYWGNVAAYVTLANRNQIKIGEAINAFAYDGGPLPLSIDCALPDKLSEGGYTLTLEAHDKDYPEYQSRLLGEPNINTSVNITVIR